jgi:ubiquinone/menaquinone biosynthesis C-methylase UbiE
MNEKEYQPEAYWDDVAKQIGNRGDHHLIAGDDEPYYRYKRRLFLGLFNKITFTGKRVLEVGSGPGGNLQLLLEKDCREIVGVDVSPKMIEVSRRLLQNKNIRIQKVDGVSLPFDDQYFDLVFTSTVLQHNTHEDQLKALIQNICRVSKNEVIIFERIEKKIKGHASNLGRPVSYYEEIFNRNGFELHRTKFLPIQASYLVCGGIRKVFNRKSKKEGEPASRLSLALQSIVLPITKLLDKIVPSGRDLAMLHFKRIK